MDMTWGSGLKSREVCRYILGIDIPVGFTGINISSAVHMPILLKCKHQLCVSCRVPLNSVDN